jgi:hypothetical protein
MAHTMAFRRIETAKNPAAGCCIAASPASARPSIVYQALPGKRSIEPNKTGHRADNLLWAGA